MELIITADSDSQPRLPARKVQSLVNLDPKLQKHPVSKPSIARSTSIRRATPFCTFFGSQFFGSFLGSGLASSHSAAEPSHEPDYPTRKDATKFDLGSPTSVRSPMTEEPYLARLFGGDLGKRLKRFTACCANYAALSRFHSSSVCLTGDRTDGTRSPGEKIMISLPAVRLFAE